MKMMPKKWTFAILIADGSPFMRRVLINIIRDHYPLAAFLEAENGDETVKMYQKYKPDLVIMEIDLSTQNGVNAFHEIMKINSKARVIINTTVPQKKKAEEAIKAGALDYVLKPFERDKIMSILNRILGHGVQVN